MKFSDEGDRLGRLSLVLFDRFDNWSFLARFYSAYYVCVCAWRHPAQECLNPLLFASQVGKETGDIEFSMVSFTLNLLVSSLSSSQIAHW
jgi:hypothetical protein